MAYKKNVVTITLGTLSLLLAGLTVAAEIEAPWVRPTAPGAKVGGAFMTLVGGQESDRVVSGSSSAAGGVEMHTHIMEDGVAKMRAIPGIEVPAGGRVELRPGGLHIMLINLKAPLSEGEIIPLRLRFEKAGVVEVKVPVTSKPAGGNSAGRSSHDMHGMQHKH